MLIHGFPLRVLKAPSNHVSHYESLFWSDCLSTGRWFITRLSVLLYLFIKITILFPHSNSSDFSCLLQVNTMEISIPFLRLYFVRIFLFTILLEVKPQLPFRNDISTVAWFLSFIMIISYVTFNLNVRFTPSYSSKLINLSSWHQCLSLRWFRNAFLSDDKLESFPYLISRWIKSTYY